MATTRFLLQALTNDNHANALQTILDGEEWDSFVASVAFVTLDGVCALEKQLSKYGPDARIYVGIRNNITSAQALDRLVETGVEVYCVDTGSIAVLFHPKLYVAFAADRAAILIGSANLTFGGLYNNIEAGALVKLDLQIADDRKALQEVLHVLGGLPKDYPGNVFCVKDSADVAGLLSEGRITDASIAVPPRPTSSDGGDDRTEEIARMPLKHAHSVFALRPYRRVAPGNLGTEEAALPRALLCSFLLVWESTGHKERDLCIPSGTNTNPTGSMFWKKGAATDIDQRHFFREEVFGELEWQVDRSRTHYERAVATFNIVIKGISYGAHTLRVSHNMRTDSPAYEQGNSMTSVSWGNAKELLGKRDLLGCIMSLYKKEGNPPEYQIEIE